jgi:hypothetical protein
MPLYTIMNTQTDELFEVNMKYDDFQNHLSENSHLKQVFTKFPAIGDPIRLGKRRPDDGFRDVLKNVSNHHKKNVINSW